MTKHFAPDDVLTRLFPTPRWFPQMVDPTQRRVRMVQFRSADFANAPFLDERAVQDGMRQAVVEWDTLANAVPEDARRDAHVIFQISHVGSTLLSRLIGAFDPFLSLREPMLLLALLSLDPAARDARLRPLLALLSRTFRPSQRAVIKANSAVNDIAGEIARETKGQMLFLRMAPERYIASRLAGSLNDLKVKAASRRARFEALIGAAIPDGGDASPAALAALAWAVEAGAMERAAGTIAPARQRFIDFDSFLRDPEGELANMLVHLGYAPPSGQVARVLAGPLFSRNAKRIGQPFDSASREQRIRDSHQIHRDEISSALAWLHGTADQSPPVKAALDR